MLQASLRSSLRRAAEREVLKSLSPSSSGAGVGVVGGRPTIDISRVYDEAWDALQALASFLAESESDGPWFSNATEPGEMDCAVFGFTFLMMWFFGVPLEIGDVGDEKKWESLGGMVQAAGKGELEGHVRRMAERAGWGGVLWEGGCLVTRG